MHLSNVSECQYEEIPYGKVLDIIFADYAPRGVRHILPPPMFPTKKHL
jgi:hypothetical protein